MKNHAEWPLRPVKRRTVLLGSLAGLAVNAGCAKPEARPVGLPPTVRDLLVDRPFYIAHRGGGRDWPEMTAYAYEQAAKVPGLKAVEISVCVSADGVLVCSHDKTTGRLTDQDWVIAERPWSALSTLRVSAAQTLDPRQPARPFTRLDAVLPRLAADFVVFIEPKIATATPLLLETLSELGQSDRIVWKQPINSRVFAEAKARGFTTWGYVLNEPAHLGANLQRYASSGKIDMLGIPLSERDGLCATVTDAARANGRPVIAQTVQTTADRARAVRLGATGLMTSAIAELLGAR